MIYTVLISVSLVIVCYKIVNSSLTKIAKSTSKADSYTEQVMLCLCGKKHNTLEKLNNVCTGCNMHIHKTGPVFYHPEKRTWVYGDEYEAIVEDVNFNIALKTLRMKEVLGTDEAITEFHCNRCGKLNLIEAKSILSTHYCYSCYNIIEDSRPK